MRKYLVIAVAAVALMAFAMPAAAVDIGASGPGSHSRQARKAQS